MDYSAGFTSEAWFQSEMTSVLSFKLDPVDYSPKPKKTIASSQPTKQAMVSPTSVKPVISNSDYFSWPNTEANESEGRSSQQGNFRMETDLHKLGYQITGLTRRKRWDSRVKSNTDNAFERNRIYHCPKRTLT